MSETPLPSDPFWQTLLERRSIRRYTDQPVPRALLERLLTAAIWAPNAHNRQPWRFAVVTERSSGEQLAEQLAARWERDLLADGTTRQWSSAASPLLASALAARARWCWAA